MKKNIGIITLAVLLAGSSFVYARGMKDDMSDKGMKGGMMMSEGMMGKGMMDGKMMAMHGMMMSMMQKQVVPTEDGGVVIVMGNKMTKYDKDLNVVKEVELKMDMEGMQKMMDNMKGMCPMMGKSMKDNDNDADDDAAEKAEHESHHPANK